MEWAERHEYAACAFVPWIEKTKSLTDALVVEFGCGNGSVLSAIAPAADRVLGLDIDALAVLEARERLADKGLTNAEAASGTFDELEERVRGLSGEIGAFVLFAALEHMTIAERLRVLSLAADVIAADGVIVVAESPNRLLPWDYHTAELAFFGMLPDELALHYLTRSRREDFKADVSAALGVGEAEALERLTRWGRGVSFHEFELAIEGFPENVVACNYEPELLPVREIYREELALARFLKRTRPDIPPAFTRYWLDFIIASDPSKMPRYIEPWSFETTNSRYVDFTEWDTLLLRGPHARLTANFDAPVDELLIGIENAVAPIELRVHGGDGELARLAAGVAVGSSPEYLSVRFQIPQTTVTVDASKACHLSFLGSAPAH